MPKTKTVADAALDSGTKESVPSSAEANEVDAVAILPQADDLPKYWRHAYFIESLRNVAASLRGSE